MQISQIVQEVFGVRFIDQYMIYDGDQGRYERRWKYAENDLLATEEFKWQSALLQVFLPDL